MMENVQALQAFSLSQQITANNVANINTNGFHSSRLDLETGPDGQGVRPQQIVENSNPGPLVQGYEPVQTESGMTYADSLVEGSNTDLAAEMVQMILDEQAFAANAAALRTQMEMKGTFIDEMV